MIAYPQVRAAINYVVEHHGPSINRNAQLSVLNRR